MDSNIHMFSEGVELIQWSVIVVCHRYPSLLAELSKQANTFTIIGGTVDTIKWEVKRLDMENQQLREASMEACKLMD